MLVSEDFHAKVGDFGLAEASKEAPQRWFASNDAVGCSDASPMWASPEALSGEAQSDRADVYSLCTVLYAAARRRATRGAALRATRGANGRRSAAPTPQV